MGDFATLRELCRFRTYYFPVIVEHTPDFDMRRVHPYKQKVIYMILNDLREMPWLTEVWLFGSSVQPYCRFESDIDIAFKMDTDEVDRLLKNDRNFDWLYPIRTRSENGSDFVNMDNIHPYCELMRNIKYYGVRLK